MRKKRPDPIGPSCRECPHCWVEGVREKPYAFAARCYESGKIVTFEYMAGQKPENCNGEPE